MLIHFGRETAAKALLELRLVRQKRGELPMTPPAGAASPSKAPANLAPLSIPTGAPAPPADDEVHTPEATTPVVAHADAGAGRSTSKKKVG